MLSSSINHTMLPIYEGLICELYREVVRDQKGGPKMVGIRVGGAAISEANQVVTGSDALLKYAKGLQPRLRSHDLIDQEGAATGRAAGRESETEASGSRGSGGVGQAGAGGDRPRGAGGGGRSG
jgi:hypothetical protein